MMSATLIRAFAVAADGDVYVAAGPADWEAYAASSTAHPTELSRNTTARDREHYSGRSRDRLKAGEGFVPKRNRLPVQANRSLDCRVNRRRFERSRSDDAQNVH